MCRVRAVIGMASVVVGCHDLLLAKPSRAGTRPGWPARSLHLKAEELWPKDPFFEVAVRPRYRLFVPNETRRSKVLGRCLSLSRTQMAKRSFFVLLHDTG